MSHESLIALRNLVTEAEEKLANAKKISADKRTKVEGILRRSNNFLKRVSAEGYSMEEDDIEDAEHYYKEVDRALSMISFAENYVGD